MVDAFWHILTEERSDLPLRLQSMCKRQRRSVKGKERTHEREEAAVVVEGSESWLRHGGFDQLYRGLLALPLLSPQTCLIPCISSTVTKMLTSGQMYK